MHICGCPIDRASRIGRIRRSIFSCFAAAQPLTYHDRAQMLATFQMHKKPILLSILFIIIFTAFQKFYQWEIANTELSKYPNTIAVLFSASSKYSFNGQVVTHTQRTQTYVLLPTSWDIAFTVSIRSNNGDITVDEDRYGVLKLLLLFLIVIPLVSNLAKKFGINEVKVKM